MSLQRMLALLVLVVALGCASTPSGQREERGSDNLVTAAELEVARETNMFDFVRARRPAWMQRARPTTIAGAGSGYPLLVYMDGTRLGELESLRGVAPSSLQLARFLAPSEAQLRYGSGHLNGVIELQTRR